MFDDSSFTSPPKKGKQHALVIVRELLAAQSQNKKTRLSNALKYFNNISKQKGIAFILSDMLDSEYEDALRVAGGKHDIIGFATPFFFKNFIIFINF